jgi:hypothetical protein
MELPYLASPTYHRCQKPTALVQTHLDGPALQGAPRVLLVAHDVVEHPVGLRARGHLRAAFQGRRVRL